MGHGTRVEIGHEKAGWVCQEQVVYVAFEFAAVEPKKEWVADPRDRLVVTRLYRSDCLDLSWIFVQWWCRTVV